MIHALLVMLGGGIGALARYGISLLLSAKYTGVFPIATLSVNLTGCLAIGIIASVGEKLGINETAKLLLITGLLGGFTTFSSFGLETLSLWKAGHTYTAMLYVLISNVGGIMLAFAGYKLFSNP